MNSRLRYDKWYSRPRNVFLIDGFGALLSVFLLGVVLLKWQKNFGIPLTTLYFLAMFPFLYALFDFYCYWKVKHNAALFINIIAYGNLCYSMISMGLAVYHFEEITRYGLSHVIAEVVILIVLARFEFGIANSTK